MWVCTVNYALELTHTMYTSVSLLTIILTLSNSNSVLDDISSTSKPIIQLQSNKNNS